MYLSAYIIVPLVAWLMAQVLKYVIHSAKVGSLKDLSYLYSSGDMPSSHSALMVSELATIAIKDGFQSPLFGVLAVITVIVLYDAMNVRRSVGEQAVVLKDLLSASGKTSDFHFAKGHTLTEVFAGSALGLTVAILILRFL